MLVLGTLYAVAGKIQNFNLNPNPFFVAVYQIQRVENRYYVFVEA